MSPDSLFIVTINSQVYYKVHDCNDQEGLLKLAKEAYQKSEGPTFIEFYSVQDMGSARAL